MVIFMNDILTILSDYTFQVVALGSVLIGLISGVIGCFAVIRKQSLLGDAISHATLPGVAIAFLITGNKNISILLLGALVAGLIATFLIISITKYSKIKFDSSLALIMTVFFGFGLLLLTYIQKIPNANQAGLNRFIFGQASTILISDIFIMLLFVVIIISFIIIFWKEIKLFTFDSEFAKTIGFNTTIINIILSFLTVLTIVIGIQTVGVILMSAMLIAPSIAARQWTDKLSVMVILAAFFGVIAGISGTLISSNVSKMPTGPVIVIIISIIAIFSILFNKIRKVWWQKKKFNIQKLNLIKESDKYEY